MPLVPTAEVIATAMAEGRGVCAFNVITIEHAQAVAAGAEAAGTPVILQVSENAVRYHRGRLGPIARAAAAVAADSAVDTALHLDHATSSELLLQAYEYGFSSAMFDASALPYAENVAKTRAAAIWAHQRGLWLEAELGEVGGKGAADGGGVHGGARDGTRAPAGAVPAAGSAPGPAAGPLAVPAPVAARTAAVRAVSAHTPGARTDPAEAREFVAATGVDALAVAVGSTHAMTAPDAILDHGLIAKLREAVPVPLVLHGSSGVPQPQLRLAVGHGMVKINIGTALNMAFTAAVREFLAADGGTVDPRKYLAPARGAMSDRVRHMLATVCQPAE